MKKQLIELTALLALAVLFSAGCAESLNPDERPEESSQQVDAETRQRHATDFQSKLQSIRTNSKGVGKADFFGIDTPCDILDRYLKRSGDQYFAPKIGMNIGY